MNKIICIPRCCKRPQRGGSREIRLTEGACHIRWVEEREKILRKDFVIYRGDSIGTARLAANVECHLTIWSC
jgi:hypothetical protein